MSTTNEQQQQQLKREEEASAKSNELPLESSPYVKYSDLEEYKKNAYGTQGHLPVVIDNNRGAGATDAPTISGNGLSEGQVDLLDFMNRHGAV